MPSATRAIERGPSETSAHCGDRIAGRACRHGKGYSRGVNPRLHAGGSVEHPHAVQPKPWSILEPWHAVHVPRCERSCSTFGTVSTHSQGKLPSTPERNCTPVGQARLPPVPRALPSLVFWITISSWPHPLPLPRPGGLSFAGSSQSKSQWCKNWMESIPAALAASGSRACIASLHC